MGVSTGHAKRDTKLKTHFRFNHRGTMFKNNFLEPKFKFVVKESLRGESVVKIFRQVRSWRKERGA